jgi:hypothetical protein
MDSEGMPFHCGRNMVLVIEDDEYRAVVAAMRSHGSSVVQFRLKFGHWDHVRLVSSQALRLLRPSAVRR